MVDASNNDLPAVLLSGWLSVNIVDLRVHCLLFQELAQLPWVISAQVLLGILVMFSSV